jgi:energy-coupling factor transport system ATP-binding protein
MGLLLIGSPVAIVVTTLALVVLALRCGERTLLLIGVSSGATLAVLSPFIANFGSDVLFDAGFVSITTQELVMALALGARLCGVVLAAALLAAVPAHELVLLIARRSQRFALLAALVARFGPLASLDAQRARDELRAAGVPFARPAPLEQRLHARALLANAVVASVVERAFATAAAIESRAFGVRPPTTDRLPMLTNIGARSGSSTLAIGASIVWLASAIASHAGGSLLTAGWSLTPIETIAGIAGAVSALLIPGTRPAVASRVHKPSAEPVLPMQNHGGARIALRAIDVRYPDAVASALQVPDLTVDPGSFVLVTGASGSGKSTLLDAIAGRVPHLSGGTLSGTVTVDGCDVTSVRPSQRATVLGSMFQDPESQSIAGIVAEEVAFGPRSIGQDIATVNERTVAALLMLGCDDIAARQVATLSGGELQRTLLAAVLALEPRALLLDEPTSQLDAEGTAAFWKAIELVRSRIDVTVIAVEHRSQMPAGIADRIVTLDGGRIIADREPGAIPHSQLAAPTPWSRGHVRMTMRNLHVRTPGGSRAIVHGFDAAIAAGAVVALHGPNGSGKTSVLRTLRGLAADFPTCNVDGVAVTDVARSVAVFGYASQHAGCFLPYATGFECAAAICERLNLPRALAARALEHAGLDDLSDRHPADMSVGQRQRLAIVAATAHQPAIWLLDEPTRGMDTTARRWLIAHVAAHARRGGIAILATHDHELTQAVATEIWTLEAGGIVRSPETGNVEEQRTMETVT